jgi:hypothetical protein
MKIKTSEALGAMAFIFAIYLSSYYLLELNIYGDQFEYIKLYQHLSQVGVDEIVELSQLYLGASEPLSVFIFWIGAKVGIDKVIYISLLNVIMCCSIILIARRAGCSYLMMLLLLLNYYVIVLSTSAERLKIAYIFLLLGALFTGRTRLVLLFCSPFCHLQSLIFLFCIIFSNYSKLITQYIANFRLRNLFRVSTLGGVVMMILLIIATFDGVRYKFSVYASQSTPVVEFVNIGLLFIVALFVSGARREMSFLVLPLVPAIFFLGASRINMIGVTLVLFQLMKERKMNHFLIYIMMIYFVIKGILFVENLIAYGDGFGG